MGGAFHVRGLCMGDMHARATHEAIHIGIRNIGNLCLLLSFAVNLQVVKKQQNKQLTLKSAEQAPQLATATSNLS